MHGDHSQHLLVKTVTKQNVSPGREVTSRLLALLHFTDMRKGTRRRERLQKPQHHRTTGLETPGGQAPQIPISCLEGTKTLDTGSHSRGQGYLVCRLLSTPPELNFSACIISRAARPPRLTGSRLVSNQDSLPTLLPLSCGCLPVLRQGIW